MITDLNKRPGHVEHAIPGAAIVTHPTTTICAYCHGLPPPAAHTWQGDPRKPPIVGSSFESDGTVAAAYTDRNLTAQALAWAALGLGWMAGVRERDAAWPILMVDLPSGQVSWHIPRAELDPRLPDYVAPWDGHDVDTKLARLRRWTE